MNNIDYKKLSRPLNSDEIEFKVQNIIKWGDEAFALLASYQEARTPMIILDNAVGLENWQLKYREANGCVVASIGIRHGDEWIWKESNGTPGDFEPEKSAYSDALKRAAVLFGIGRGLYSFPRIRVKLLDGEYTVEGNKAKATSKLRPMDWDWSVEYNDKGDVMKLEAKQEQKGPGPRTLTRFSYTTK